MTENAIMNISVPGYANGLNLPNSSCPAVSLHYPTFTTVPNL